MNDVFDLLTNSIEISLFRKNKLIQKFTSIKFLSTYLYFKLNFQSLIFYIYNCKIQKKNCAIKTLLYINQICKLLRHIATTEALQVSAKHAEVNLRVYAPQIVTAAQALAHYPCSKIIKENLEGWLIFFFFFSKSFELFVFQKNMYYL